MGRGAWWATVDGVTESDMIELRHYNHNIKKASGLSGNQHYQASDTMRSHFIKHITL